MSASASSGISTAQLSELTGVAAATVRMWEARHGFPVPVRLPGGHRRYSESDVEQVRAVLAARAEGLSLAAAIERTLSSAMAPPASIFGGVAQRRPGIRPMTLAKPALLALSRAIEDEVCARGGAGVLVGSFQTARFYRQSASRWRELARTAEVAVALADFRMARRRPGRPVEIPVRREHPLAREWAVVHHSPGSSACLAAWEIPSARCADRERRFEVLWSPEPDAALVALTVAAQVVEPVSASAAGALLEAAAVPAVPGTPELQAAVAQARRMIAYLGETS